MKCFLLLILIFLSAKFEVWGQSVTLNEVRVEADSTTKMIDVKIAIDGIKLDSLNRVKLLGNAYALTGESKKYHSDWFHSDDYLDNYDNKYTIVFDSVPNEVNRFETIDGTLRFFNPSKEKNSIVRVINDRSTFNSDIVPLASTNIHVVPIDGFFLHKLKWKKRKLRDYIKEITYQNQLNEILLLETLSKFFEQNKKSKFLKDVSDYILFYIENYEYEVVSIYIDDTNQKKKQFVGSKLNGPRSAIWSFRNYGAKLDSDFVIEVVFENAHSVTDFKFQLRDVGLK